MSDEGTSVTLILYKVGAKWWEEPALNLVAAAAQFSPYTHVELAIGEDAGAGGMMKNVLRCGSSSSATFHAPCSL
tara:strand:+ start:384 stop:608 length:225 start_codon:yes stop_codon:yes gene_type:complete